MTHRTNANFWKHYGKLPADVQGRADKQYALLRTNPQHPSLHLKKVNERGGKEVWSVRITQKYRALAVRLHDDFLWFWIGEHDEYEERIS